MKNIKDKIINTIENLQAVLPEFEIVVILSLEEFNSNKTITKDIDTGTNIGGIQLNYTMGFMYIDDLHIKVIGSSNLINNEPNVYILPKYANNTL